MKNCSLILFFFVRGSDILHFQTFDCDYTDTCDKNSLEILYFFQKVLLNIYYFFLKKKKKTVDQLLEPLNHRYLEREAAFNKYNCMIP
jgi:hypothetical protein